MPAKLTVVSGVSVGRSMWISQEVLGIGSHPKADLCIPSARIADRAVTLEFRDGQYFAYNRGGEKIVLGQMPLEPGAVFAWPPGQELELPGDVRLLLEIEGDPDPSAPAPKTRIAVAVDEEIAGEPPPADAEDAQPPQPAEAAANRAARAKLAVQWVLIALCVVGIIWTIKAKFLAPTDQAAEKESVVTFAVLNDAYAKHAQSTPPDKDLTILFRELGLAEAKWLRPGTAQEGHRELQRVRDGLLRRKAHKNRFETDLEDLMFKFVTMRLAEVPK